MGERRGWLREERDKERRDSKIEKERDTLEILKKS